MPRSIAIGALCVLTLTACRTTVEEAPAGVAASQPILLRAGRMWRVMDGERIAGMVVRFDAAGAEDDATRHYFSVRNELHQELGTIDGHGRAWRFEPHQSTPRFLGTGGVLDGARAILGLGERGELNEVPLDAR